MKIKTRLGIYAIIILTVAVFTLSWLYRNSLEEKGRLKDNQNSLLSEIKHYVTKDSLNVASVEKLTLSNHEFKTHNEGLVKTVESLNIKVRRLQSVSETAISSDYTIKTRIKDSIRWTDKSKPPDTLKCIDHKEKWLQIKGCIEKKEFSGSIHIPDTIIQIVHRVPRKFLFIKYGTKAIRQEVLSKNPHTSIAFTKYIEFKK